MAEDLSARRRRLLGPHVPTFYREPLQIVRGEGVWLWDAGGKRYLDAYNNVPHVGHGNPHVVEAIARQARALNTHTRYLHPLVLDYAERLLATFDHGLDTLTMVCTGSEANDLALRMAQAVTGRTGVITTDNTYHGNTTAVSQLNTRRPPLGGYGPHVRQVPAPDSLHPVGGARAGQAEAFARHVQAAIDDLDAAGFGLSALVVCPAFANEGLPEPGTGFLDGAAAAVRRSGGVVIADDVQGGFGRCGRDFWSHDRLGLAPEIVTLGKPMGNGYPVGGVVARHDITAAFRAAYGYFNTFAGTPVACAAAMAVLDVMAREDLADRAATTGDMLLRRLRALSPPLVAEVRGAGLFAAVEMASAEAAERAVEGMKARGVLIHRIGRHDHILKIRPPLVFGPAHAEILSAALCEVLEGLAPE